MLGTMYNLKIFKLRFLWLSSLFLSDHIGCMSFHLQAFSVVQKYQNPTNSLIDNNKQLIGDMCSNCVYLNYL